MWIKDLEGGSLLEHDQGSVYLSADEDGFTAFFYDQAGKETNDNPIFGTDESSVKQEVEVYLKKN